MRRLVLLLSSIVALDIMFFAALAPLLPHFVSQYGLSKSAAGVLSATYAAGVLAASVPGGLAASRYGPRQAALGGVALTAAASLAFALSHDVWMLGAARFLQGVGSAFSWSGALAWLVAAAPRDRRGALIGATMGAAVFGALLGPVLGAIAERGGCALDVPGRERARARVRCLGARDARGAGATSIALGASARRSAPARWALAPRPPGAALRSVAVLVPLKLHAQGWGGVAIGAVFLATAGSRWC